MSTKWTDPARVKNLHKSTRWTNPTRDQDSCPRSGRTQQGLKNYVLKVDEPNKGQKLTQVHKMDGPHEGSRFLSTKWTDPTRVKKLCPQSGRTQIRVKNLHKSTRWTDPTRDQDSCPQSGRTQQGSKNYVHKMDRPYEGSRFISTK